VVDPVYPGLIWTASQIVVKKSPLNFPDQEHSSQTPIKPDLHRTLCAACVRNAWQAKIREARPVSGELGATDVQ
jgi:hypothetical protein